VGLENPDHPGAGGKDGNGLLGSRGFAAGGRGRGEDAAVAGALPRQNRHHQTVKPLDASFYQRFPQPDAGLVHQITGLEVVEGADNNVV